MCNNSVPELTPELAHEAGDSSDGNQGRADPEEHYAKTLPRIQTIGPGLDSGSFSNAFSTAAGRKPKTCGVLNLFSYPGIIDRSLAATARPI